MSEALAELLFGDGLDADAPAVHDGPGPRRSAPPRARADEVAEALRAAGAGDGRAVVVMLPNRADLVAALFGVWRAGGVYVPLNPRLTEREVAHVLESVRPAAVVTTSDQRDRLRRLPTVVLDDGAPPSGGDRATLAAATALDERHGARPVHVGHDRSAQAGAAHPRRRARAARRRDRHASAARAPAKDGADRAEGRRCPT